MHKSESTFEKMKFHANSTSASRMHPYLQAHLNSSRKLFIALAVFSLCINLLTLTIPLYLLQIYNRVIPNRSIDTLMFLTAIVVVALVAMVLLEAIRGFILARFGSWLDKRLAGFVLSGSIIRSLGKHRGSSIQVFRDLVTLRNLFSSSTLFPVLDAPWSPIIIFVLYMLHPMIGISVLIGALGLLSLALYNERAARKVIERSTGSSAKVIDEAAALLRNADAIEAMGMRHNIIRYWESKNEAALDLHIKTSLSAGWIYAIARFFRTVLQIAVIAIATWLIINNQLTSGALIACVLLMRRAIAPLDKIIDSWKAIVKARSALENISNRLYRAPEFETPELLPKPGGYLSVRKVDFSYAKSSGKTLSNITFKLNPGETIGLIGNTAAGKSTLAQLLTGLVKPSSGYVRLNGIDMARWDSEALGPYVGYVPQNTQLFSGTVAQNIARMGSLDLNTIIAAAQLTDTHEMIMQMPKDYNTEIGENGVYLSGGQRQRIALARAVYGKPKLIVMDEPDASLDESGRTALINTLQRLKAKGTMIVLITHHHEMLKYTDHVLSLRKGRMETITSSMIKALGLPDAAKISRSKVICINSDKNRENNAS